MRVMGLLSAGNIEMPNAQLQVEWFYMTFHKSDCTEYLQSGRKLRNKMLQSLAEYIQVIHKTRENDGSLQRHQLKKVQAEARCKMRQELEERYHTRCAISPISRRATGRMLDATMTILVIIMVDASNASPTTTAVVNDKRNDKKSPPEHKGKGFKPCRIHSEHTNYSYKECHTNPCNQAHYKCTNNSNKKRRH